jgi:hypothetical protein
MYKIEKRGSMYQVNLQRIKRINKSDIVLWIIAIITLLSIVNTSFKKDYKTGIIEADAKGYYAYLPAIFIYHDLNFGFYDEIERVTYYNPNLGYEYLREHNSKTINKYYVGTSVCLAPFFLTGHVLTLITGRVADGYSYYYTMMVHLGALFYLILGLVGLQKLLRLYKADENVIAVILLAITLGTNLFYYVVTEFAMSHVYSFTAITWFCIFIRRYFTGNEIKHMIYSLLILGIIVLIRPVNLLIVFSIPFLAGSSELLMTGIKSLFKQKWKLLPGILGFVLLISIQLIIYKLSTGSYIVYSYKEEGFNFLNPHLGNFLFSYRKGMFVYMPILFVSMAGFIFLLHESRYKFFTLVGFLFIIIYIFSSWHMWFYGGSFGQRVMIDFYAFFAILLATKLQQMKIKRIRQLYIGIIALLIIMCQVQTYQYRRMQIHWSDMNKEKYWEVFMRIDKL